MKSQSISTYCKVCLLPHDEEIHEATLSVRSWHRCQVVKSFEVEEETVAASEVPEFAEPLVA